MEPTEAGSPRILVVDDEKALARMVANYLERAGYTTRLEHTGPDALAAVGSWDPDVVILDLGLPGLDGMEVCRQLRATSDAYVIMLTARDDEFDTLMGFAAGADDYVTKPFSTRTLVSRVQAVLRRPRVRPDRAAGAADAPASPAEDEPTGLDRTFGGLRIDVAGHEAFLHGAPLALTPTEFSLLLVLSEKPKWAFSRRRLLDTVWGEHWVGDDHIVDVHIGNLRRKLGDDPEHPRFILTVRGVGYRMGQG
ncbi:response regulator transcription factor [Raineyella fluvialis]|nr:response regulator transcription factor [Raineyella fluvialis]